MGYLLCVINKCLKILGNVFKKGTCITALNHDHSSINFEEYCNDTGIVKNTSLVIKLSFSKYEYNGHFVTTMGLIDEIRLTNNNSIYKGCFVETIDTEKWINIDRYDHKTRYCYKVINGKISEVHIVTISAGGPIAIFKLKK